MYPATDRVLLEHARLKLSHSHETERRAAEYTAQLERRVCELDIDLGRARDEASQLREELRRAKAAASEEVRCSAAATRSVKDLQAEVEKAQASATQAALEAQEATAQADQLQSQLNDAEDAATRLTAEVAQLTRSEERRVGKECSVGCRSRWSPYH
jgi:chromosome segregation ATPase